jgi:hypothetical protein
MVVSIIMVMMFFDVPQKRQSHAAEWTIVNRRYHRQTSFMMVFDVNRTPSERKLARLADVAARAGVSTATADRVLNRRPGVRASTAQKVFRAAIELDYLPEQEIRSAAAPEPMRLVFLLPRGSNRYLRMLGDTVGYAQEHFAPLNAKCQVEYVESFNPDALAQALAKHGRRADGIAFMALEHPAVREAVNTLAQRGVPTVTLISDIANSARGLRGPGQPRRRPHRRVPDRALHRFAGGARGADRRVAPLPGARGTRRRLPAVVRGTVPGHAGGGPARRLRRRAAEL